MEAEAYLEMPSSVPSQVFGSGKRLARRKRGSTSGLSSIINPQIINHR
jgi:hypothetical protein